MFDIFGIKARRKAKQEAAEKATLERKRVYQERKAKIDTFLDNYLSKQRDKASKKYDADREWAEKHNSKCPKCGSKNIINLIRMTKGGDSR